MKIHLDPLDLLVSEYVRRRSKGYCDRCGAYYGWEKLQACHFHGRGSRSVRYDEDNLAAMDFGCHSYLDGHPLEKVEFFLKRLGIEKFDRLNARYRNTRPRPDKKLLALYYQEQIRKLK